MAADDIPILQLGYLQQRFVLGSPSRVRRSSTSASHVYARSDTSGHLVTSGREEQAEEMALADRNGDKAELSDGDRADKKNNGLIKGRGRATEGGLSVQALVKANCWVTFIAIVGGMCWRVFRHAK